MKTFVFITLALLCTVGSNDLFEGITFNEQGTGYKINIPVTYNSVGKDSNETSLKTLKKDFRSTTAISFTYNNRNYYLPIEEQNLPDFIFEVKEGDLIFIDIVVFNVKNCHSTGKQTNEYCSYINKIRQQ